MEKMSLFTILALTVTSLSFLIGGWHVSLTVLVAFMVIDIVTGVMVSFVQKRLSSKVAFVGFLKKATIMIVIVLANLLDVLTASGVPVFRTMAIYFYIGMEGLSITENLVRIGVPLPKGIKERLMQLANEENEQKY
ncbi:holin family protein [Lysinibacillus sp. Ag94]|uniref:phage holin family protein n=1 Tax=unclassified Lysinibacillus TaxID=2636778 RepID=UPI001045CDFB|nr:phage holin family protein [Lysinibacillus sp. Ag94]UPW81769.1 phage holin family protein [Lysinibacillus sp. Ag94]